MGRLSGKVAIVTGAARGMGLVTAQVFIEAGAKVVLCDVLAEEGRAAAAKLGSAAMFRALDITDEAQWQKAVADTVAHFGTVDALVNNAGVVAFSLIEETKRGDFARVIDINLIGTFLGIKSVVPTMAAQQRGSIVNISSAEGLKGSNGLSAYAASKWGVRGLTKVAALELGHRGIRVNSIHPGGVNTVMGNVMGEPEADLAKYYTNQPIQRIARPEEIAQTSLFLASDEASYICGAEIAVDGGMTAGHYISFLPGTPPAAT